MDGPVTHFVHLEVVHPDPDQAAAFLRDVLGAVEVETSISRYAETLAPGLRCIHMKLGNVVIQYIKPVPGLESWREHLAAHGPSVHNVTVFVKDPEAMREAMAAHGGTEAAVLPVDLSSVLPEAGPQTAYLFDCLEQTGLRFEFVDPIPGLEPGLLP
jgi:catechol 2,3-dioxygenase-like lactoylglutathione lyase family enzyme